MASSFSREMPQTDDSSPNHSNLHSYLWVVPIEYVSYIFPTILFKKLIQELQKDIWFIMSIKITLEKHGLSSGLIEAIDACFI